MVMKILLVALLIVSFVSTGTDAFTPRDAVETVDGPSVAWLEDDILFVAVVNTARARERFTIEPPDRRWRSRPFEDLRVIVPGQTVMLESLRLDSEWLRAHEGELEEVIIDGGRAGRYEIPVQESISAMGVQYFVVQSDTRFEIDIDLQSLTDDARFSRLVIDEDYRMLGSRERGSIRIGDFSGGFVYDSRRNEVRYEAPHMSLEMRAPRIRETDLLTFDVTYYDHRDRSTVVKGPQILVYGTDYRFVDNAPHSPSRVR